MGKVAAAALRGVPACRRRATGPRGPGDPPPAQPPVPAAPGRPRAQANPSPRGDLPDSPDRKESSYTPREELQGPSKDKWGRKPRVKPVWHGSDFVSVP